MPLILAIFLLFGVTSQAAASSGVIHASGSASWYALDGNRTANGEIMNSSNMTAAHRTLPMGTKVRVTNLRNGKSVVVRINDRGPFAKGRILDVSKGAARELGFVSSGHTDVRVARLDAAADSTAKVISEPKAKKIVAATTPKGRPVVEAPEAQASILTAKQALPTPGVAERTNKRPHTLAELFQRVSTSASSARARRAAEDR